MLSKSWNNATLLDSPLLVVPTVVTENRTAFNSFQQIAQFKHGMIGLGVHLNFSSFSFGFTLNYDTITVPTVVVLSVFLFKNWGICGLLLSFFLFKSLFLDIFLLQVWL